MGSIARRKDGKWRARIVLDDGVTQRARHFARKKDAEDWLAEQVVRMRDGSFVDPMRGRRTFKEYAETWFALQVHYRPSTRSRVGSLLHKHLIPTFGEMPLVAIQRSHVQAWVKGLKLAPASVEGVYRLLATILRSAVDDHMLTTTPCRKVNLPERTASKIVVPEVEVVARIIGLLPDRAKPIPALAAGAGLRLGEVLGLTVDRVNFLGKTIRVDQQWVTGPHGSQLGPVKTKASNRTVPVPEDLTGLLAAHLAAFPSSGFLFTHKAGRPWRRQNWNVLWNDACDKAKVSVRFHDLRHLYASTLIDAGGSPVVVAQRLGHASIKETLDTYSHLFPKDEDSTRTAAGGLIRALAK